MSGSTSSTSADEAEIARDAEASARAPRSLPVALSPLELRKLVDDHNWHRQGGPGFHERLVRATHRVSGSVLSYGGDPPSPTSSMALSFQAPSTASAFFTNSIYSSHDSVCSPPSLTECLTAESASSLHTRRSDSIVEQTYGFATDDEGTLLAPERAASEPSLVCLFEFLGCRKRFRAVREWSGHCESHLRGYPPKTMRCPFRCAWVKSVSGGAEAWQSFMEHIVSEHREECFADDAPRPDMSLLTHMWRNRIISETQYQELVRTGRTEGGRAYAISSNTEQRQRRARRGR